MEFVAAGEILDLVDLACNSHQFEYPKAGPKWGLQA
jgi:hypothetical protein